jgi:hypothetical protein
VVDVAYDGAFVREKRLKRTVAAPPPSLHGAAASAVTSVVLNPGEAVRWIWTHTPAGSYVSGYSIVEARKKPKRRAA